ncbi:MAG: hypothetical protein H0U13_10110 [Gemmatimonadaceae bacterium]|nr:hypothetical protein [Gemmatimonadaceae bacterium]
MNQYVAADIAGEFGIVPWPPGLVFSVPLPDVGCCPPFVSPRPCNPPSWPYANLNVRSWEYGDIDNFGALCDPRHATPVLELLSAAVSFLRDNIDIVEWALCLVAGYVPRGAFANVNANLDTLVQGVTQMVLGITPNPEWPNWTGANAPPDWTVTIHGMKVDGPRFTAEEPMSSVAFTTPNGDGSIGVNVAAYSTRIQNWLASWQSADPAVQVCGVASCAGTLLHELVHVWVKLQDYDGNVADYGYHEWYPGDEDDPKEPEPVPVPWDTARMANTVFMWAAARRYALWCGTTSYPNERFLSSDVPVAETPAHPGAYICTNYIRAKPIVYPCPEVVDVPDDPGPSWIGFVPLGLDDLRPITTYAWGEGYILDGAYVMPQPTFI